MSSVAEEAEAAAKKSFDVQDKEWTGPRFVGLAIVTLVIAIGLIYAMSTTTGCSVGPQPSF
jgi:hypothetical protein